MNQLLHIGIVGTAGRGTDATKINKDIYNEMVKVVGGIRFLHEIALVSGGAACADHLAVITFLLRRCKSLRLHLPCEWDFEKQQFVDLGTKDWRTNPGGTSNYYHRQFSKSIGEHENTSLRQIDAAIKLGAQPIVGKGFFDRNTAIAQESSMLFAFTFGDGPRIADGGTRDTFVKFIKSKPDATAYHYNLHEMKIYIAE